MAKKSPRKRPVTHSSAGRPTHATRDQRKPRFKNRTLWVGRTKIKQFDGPADVQELILKAFQEQHWQHRIDDPLPPKHGKDPKKRLHDAVRRLNGHQRTTLLRFPVTGRGTAITWEFVK